MRAELVVVQGEYVEVCGERERLTRQLEEVKREEGEKGEKGRREERKGKGDERGSKEGRERETEPSGRENGRGKGEQQRRGTREACIILCMISISIIHVLCPSLFLLSPIL